MRGSASTEAKKDESNTGCDWAAGFRYVTVRSRLASVLKLMNRLFLSFSIGGGGRC
jgi:hypothetical protein